MKKIFAIALGALLLMTAGASAQSCPNGTRVEAIAAFAEEPVNKIVADLSGKDADAFLEQIGAPSAPEGTTVLIVTFPDDPINLGVAIFVGDCFVGGVKIPLSVANKLLKRTSA